MPNQLEFDRIIMGLAQNPKLPEVAYQANIFVSPSTAIA